MSGEGDSTGQILYEEHRKNMFDAVPALFPGAWPDWEQLPAYLREVWSKTASEFASWYY